MYFLSILIIFALLMQNEIPVCCSLFDELMVAENGPSIIITDQNAAMTKVVGEAPKPSLPEASVCHRGEFMAVLATRTPWLPNDTRRDNRESCIASFYAVSQIKCNKYITYFMFLLS